MRCTNCDIHWPDTEKVCNTCGREMLRYYTVVVKDYPSSQWCITFGDIERKVAMDEKDWYVKWADCYHCKIITTSPEQVDIIAKVAELNNQRSTV